MMSLRGLDSMVYADGEPDLFQRSFLNSRAETISGGADEIQHNIVGERVLGLPKGPG